MRYIFTMMVILVSSGLVSPSSGEVRSERGDQQATAASVGKIQGTVDQMNQTLSDIQAQLRRIDESKATAKEVTDVRSDLVEIRGIVHANFLSTVESIGGLAVFLLGIFGAGFWKLWDIIEKRTSTLHEALDTLTSRVNALVEQRFRT